MSKKKVIAIILILFVVVALAVLALFIVRNVNEKPPVVVDQSMNPSSNEETSAATSQEKIYTATLSGTDDIHWGQGTITINSNQDNPVLSFKDDFKVAQGPDLFVYLSPNAAGAELGEFASLGALKAIEGAKDYVLPSNYKDYKTIVIWCRAFSVTFATAEFNFN